MNKLLLYYQRANEIPDNYRYKEAQINQEIFVRDVLCNNLLNTLCFHIHTHHSKSLNLSTYGFIMNNGIKVQLSNNFYRWVVSIELPKALPDNYIDNDLIINNVDSKNYYEILNYGPYNPTDNKCTKFTIEVSEQYSVYTLMYLLNKAFPKIELRFDYRDINDIAESIKQIYNANGVYIDDDFIKLSGYEVLEKTYNILLDTIGYSTTTYNIINEPDTLASYICKYPEIKKVFLLEEYMFNQKFE